MSSKTIVLTEPTVLNTKHTYAHTQTIRGLIARIRELELKAQVPAQGVSKTALLLKALATGGSTKDLMTATGFDAKNLSVTLTLLKKKGHVINITLLDSVHRFYKLA